MVHPERTRKFGKETAFTAKAVSVISSFSGIPLTRTVSHLLAAIDPPRQQCSLHCQATASHMQ
jgi:hypothetical protein